MMIVPLASIAVSGILILLLCIGDPKRRRTAGVDGREMSVATRRLLAAFACLPGLLCALMGDAAAFMIWLGGCGVIGWFVALWFGKPRKDAR